MCPDKNARLVFGASKLATVCPLDSMKPRILRALTLLPICRGAAFYSNICLLGGLLSTHCLVCHFLSNAESLCAHVVHTLLIFVSELHWSHVSGPELDFVCLLVSVLLSFSSPHGS